MQYEKPKQNIFAIGVDQLLSNSALYDNRCLENIKKLYKTTSKHEDQQHCKEMIEAALVSTPEGCTDNSLMKPNPSVSTKKTSARKPLCKFTETLNVKHKTAVRRFDAAKENCKATKKVNVLC